VPVVVPLGQVSQARGRREDAYVVGPTWQYLSFIRITNGKVHDVRIFDEITPEARTFYLIDRGYVDFERLFHFTRTPDMGHGSKFTRRRQPTNFVQLLTGQK
jgi:hypothetical protein